MKAIIKNIFLVGALSCVILMIIGMFLYDYLPNSTTVTKANVYEASSSTTKVLADIKQESENLFSGTEEDSSGTPNLLLKTYTVTNTDLSQYAKSGSYEHGKSDPFSETPKQEETPDGEKPSNGQEGNNTTNNNTTVNKPDGTLYNSTNRK